MIDFRAKMSQSEVKKKINPVDIYDDLDRTSVTGPLRQAQEEVLQEWFLNYKDKKNLVVKLHTGAGKTLIGLLMLQSKLNEGEGPCIYVCPNKYLMNQVCYEATKFGIPVCTIGGNNIIPRDFSEGKMILITYVHKLFNGKTIFGIGNNYEDAGCIVIDDAHACLDAIRAAFIITIKRKDNKKLYSEILSLFEDDLSAQGEGTLLDIKNNQDYESSMLIPYWSWISKKTEILNLLSQYSNESYITYTWPLIKNYIEKCQAFINSREIEIMPINFSVDIFGTFANARNRILMSATTQDDVFFVKTLNFDIDSIKNPLKQNKTVWSGEKMILLPSLIDDSLDRNKIIDNLTRYSYKFGVVSLVPSYKKQDDYIEKGCTAINSSNIFENIRNLKESNFDKILVLANRYDGIDLPDNACRILIIDSMPFFTNMADKYEETSRINCELVQKKLAQKIEQGLGRSVRGEKDYSCIVIIGADIVKFIRSKSTEKLFSAQTQKQIEIGMNIAKWTKEDKKKGEDSFRSLLALINQCLKRDEGWKEFYKSEMDKIEEKNDSDDKIYKMILAEKKSEELYMKENYDGAIIELQKLLDENNFDRSDKGWYLQIMARCKYHISQLESNKYQKAAFECNPELLKPNEGINYTKINNINTNRARKLIDNIKTFSSYDQLMLEVNNVIEDLSFGMQAEKFERALEKIGHMLGFESQRPDKLIRKGPDNLWYIGNNSYIMYECKSEVSNERSEINKSEVGQMNNHCAWFDSEYGDANVLRILVIPTNVVSFAGDFTHDVKIMRKNKLRLFKRNILNFFKELKEYDIKNLDEEFVDKCLRQCNINSENLVSDYHENWKRT